MTSDRLTVFGDLAEDFGFKDLYDELVSRAKMSTRVVELWRRGECTRHLVRGPEAVSPIYKSWLESQLGPIPSYYDRANYEAWNHRKDRDIDIERFLDHLKTLGYEIFTCVVEKLA